MASQIFKKKSAEDAADTAASEMSKQFDKLQSDLSDLTNRMSEFGSGNSDLRKEGERVLRKASNKASNVVDKVADHSGDLIDQVDQFARERPLVTMGLAATAGFALAVALSRR